MKNFVKGSVLAGSVLPFLTFAQVDTDAFDILDVIATFVSRSIPVLVAISLAVFIFGGIKFIFAKDADKKKEARGLVINGIIGLFVIVSVWGLVSLISSTFDVGAGKLDDRNLPGIQGF